MNFNFNFSALPTNNEWLTPQMVDYAVRAIQEDYLDSEKIEKWLAAYQKPNDFTPRRVGIIAAGNLPLVGFFDLLCAVTVGHSVTFQPSSKDIFMEVVASSLGERVELCRHIDRYDVDMVIATGSDATRAIFAEKFRGLPMLLRGERHSVAVLDGAESEQELEGMVDDMFLYYGLGCRNVSRLFLPAGYDVEALALFCARYASKYDAPIFRDNYRYQRAQAVMCGEEFVDGGFFILKRTSTPDIAVVGYDFGAPRLDMDKVQCVVGHGHLPFGRAQRPQLTDYPDGIDVMQFLGMIPCRF